ncbi:MAG TPA: hypothetical protein VF395_14965 [Polyangiaceae bacterium]
MPSRKPKDLVLIHGRTKDGTGLGVLRARDERLEIGTMRPLEEGKAIHGEVVKLTPRPETPLLFDAETQYSASEASEASEAPLAKADMSAQAKEDAPGAGVGPPQVASEAYRKNWDAIWKRTPSKRDKLVN